MPDFCKTAALAFLISATSQALAINILQVGDSHTEGHYGTFMKQFLENPGSVCDVPSQNNQVSLYGLGSSSPRHWGDSRRRNGEGAWFCSRSQVRQHITGQSSRTIPASDICQQGKSPFASVYDSTNPDLVVFTFSHNSMFLRNNQRALNTYIHRQLDILSNDTECIYITDPPAPRFDRNHVEGIEDAFVRSIQEWNQERASQGKTTCAIVEGMTAHTETQFNAHRNYLKSDRWHLTETGAQFFANDVGQRICQSYMDRFSTGGSNSGVFETEGGYVEPKGWDDGHN